MFSFFSHGFRYMDLTRGRGGEGGEVSPALFRKFEKSALIWGKNSLIIVIYR